MPSATKSTLDATCSNHLFLLAIWAGLYCDSLICVPEVAAEILGGTPEEAALRYFRDSTGLERAEVQALPRPEDSLPVVKEFLVSSPDGNARMQIGVAPVEEYSLCHGWELAHSQTE